MKKAGLLFIITLLLTACPCVLDYDEPELLFYVQNNSNRIIYVYADTLCDHTIDISSLKSDKYADGHGTVLHPYKSGVIVDFAMNRQTFFSKYPCLKVYICTFNMDSILETYQVSESTLSADDWVLKYEDK